MPAIRSSIGFSLSTRQMLNDELDAWKRWATRDYAMARIVVS